MKSFVIKKQNSDDVFRQFVEASQQIADDLKVSKKDVKIERYETPTVGISYTAEGIGKKHRFTFHLKTWAKKKDVLSGRISPSLEIFYSDSTAPFWFHDRDLQYLQPHPNFLGRWAAWVVFQFNLKHNPTNLESLFNEMDLRVYGIPLQTFPTIGEAHFLLGGINKYHTKRLLVYKFRHVSNDVRYRSFSYAFLCSHNDLHHFWVFFLNCGGLDSGGANGDLLTIEKLISNIKVKVERKNFDIEYEDLESFLKKESMAFRTEIEESDPYIVQYVSTRSFGEDFEESYSNFESRYNQKDYAGAMRDLRALVQEAMEIICDKKEISLGNIQNKKIANIADKIKKDDLIDDVLYNWFLTFSSGANLSSHKGFPTKKDMQNEIIHRRIMTTFFMGTHLISELSKIINPPKPITVKSSKEFKIKISTKKVPVGKTLHETYDGIENINKPQKKK